MASTDCPEGMKICVICNKVYNPNNVEDAKAHIHSMADDVFVSDFDYDKWIKETPSRMYWQSEIKEQDMPHDITPLHHPKILAERMLENSKTEGACGGFALVVRRNANGHLEVWNDMCGVDENLLLRVFMEKVMEILEGTPVSPPE